MECIFFLIRSTTCVYVIVNCTCLSSKFHCSLRPSIGTTACFCMTEQGLAQGKHDGTCVLVPLAQLQSLMVCTGESLQWLPPHGPLNTSGHMVCSVSRERVSWTEPDSSVHSAKPLGCRTAVVKICLASVSWSTCIITSSQLCITPCYISLYIRLCSLNHSQWDICMLRWRLDPWSAGCLRGTIL